MIDIQISGIIGGIAEAATKANPIEPEDYKGEDGLMYCGKCRTRKQCRLPNGMVVYCTCKCKEAANKAEEEAFKRRLEQEAIKRTRSEAFCDRAMYGCTFANDDGANPKLTEAARRYVEHFDSLSKQGKGLLLYGTCGTGKTYVACEIANALIDKGYPVMMTSTVRIINALTGKQDNKQQYLDGLIRVRLLVLDDIGVERDTAYTNEVLFTVIDGRTRIGLPTIVTTNLSAEELQHATDPARERIYSRLLSVCHPIEVNGADRRKQQLKDGHALMKELLGM